MVRSRERVRLTWPLPHLALTTCSEALSEDVSFPAQQSASLLASKVYYNLGQHDEALAFALPAGKLFNIELSGEPDTAETEFVQTVIG